MSASQESAATALDPTVITLLSIFGGATLTAIAGFFGAWIQGRREHARWLRERRYEAYATAAGVWRELQAADIGAAHVKPGTEAAEMVRRRYEAVLGRIGSAVGTVALLGPDAVEEVSSDALNAVHSKDPKRVEQAMRRFMVEARKALDIDGKRHSPSLR